MCISWVARTQISRLYCDRDFVIKENRLAKYIMYEIGILKDIKFKDVKCIFQSAIFQKKNVCFKEKGLNAGPKISVSLFEIWVYKG